MHWCGIDVAKRKHMVAVLDPAGQVVQAPFGIENTQAGFKRLREMLAGLAEPVQVGMEAIGHYWLALYEYLTRHDYEVVVFNPLQIHAYRKSGLRKLKHDRSDAVWTADFLRIGQRSSTAQPNSEFLQLRELSRFRYHLTDRIGDCKRKVISVLDRIFPEYETVFSSVFLASSRRLLQEAASAHEIAEFDLDELTALLHQASRGRFGREKATKLQTLARQSTQYRTNWVGIGVTFLADAAKIELRCLLAQIELLETQREQVDEALAELMAQLPQHITTIPGVSATTGAATQSRGSCTGSWGEIGDAQSSAVTCRLHRDKGTALGTALPGCREARRLGRHRRHRIPNRTVRGAAHAHEQTRLALSAPRPLAGCFDGHPVRAGTQGLL